MSHGFVCNLVNCCYYAIVRFTNIPMPHSSNNMYKTNYHNGRRYKVAEAIQFESDFSKWILTHRYQLGVLKNHLQTLDPKKIEFKIERYFYFLHTDVYTKKGHKKKLDVTNYVKALDDCLFTELGYDDSLIMHSISRKLVGDTRHVECEISVIDLDGTGLGMKPNASKDSIT